MRALAGNYSIGRGRGCDVLLTHVSVSRRHAELAVGADGSLELRDCGSTGGTFIVRGEKEIPVSNSPVKPADILRFGEYDIPVADLLSLIPEKKREPAPAIITPAPARAPAPGPRLRMMRCACGSIKERGKPCPDCGA